MTVNRRFFMLDGDPAAGHPGLVLIVALGDSLTAGFPLEPFSWTLGLEKLPAEIVNRGINGDTLAGMLARLERDVLNLLPACCFFMGGSNDAFQGRTLASMQADASRLKDAIEGAGIRCVIGLPPPTLFGELEERLDPFRDWIRENHENTLDFRTAFGDNDEIDPESLPDGVHPSRAAYEKMGKKALEFFRGLDLKEKDAKAP